MEAKLLLEEKILTSNRLMGSPVVDSSLIVDARGKHKFELVGLAVAFRVGDSVVVVGVMGFRVGALVMGFRVGALVTGALVGEGVMGFRVGALVTGALMGEGVMGFRVGALVMGFRVGALVTGALVGEGVTGFRVGALVTPKFFVANDGSLETRHK
jgi:hypothetical protein